MSAVVVDTDVFSFLFKNDSRAEPYRQEIDGRTLCLSFMTVAELRRWAIQRKWGERRRDRLNHAIQQAQTLGIDDETIRLWAEIAVERERHGRPIECGDCWIAATAVRYEIPLVTHNVTDYLGVQRLRLVTYGRA